MHVEKIKNLRLQINRNSIFLFPYHLIKLTLESIDLDKITLHLLIWTCQRDMSSRWNQDKGLEEGDSPLDLFILNIHLYRNI